MVSSTFDTLIYWQTLKNSGISEKQADAITAATSKAVSQLINAQEFSTKSDIREQINNLEIRLTRTLHDNTWRIVTIIGGIQALILGIFGISQYLLK